MDLQRLAELINAHVWVPYPWKARYVDEAWGMPCRIVQFSTNDRDVKNICDYDLDKSDLYNAYWIIWCLDRLQELYDGHWAAKRTNLEYSVDLIGKPSTSEAGFFIEVTAYPESDARAVAATYPDAPTRAEACALALLTTLEG